MNLKDFFKKILVHLTVVWQKLKPYLVRFQLFFKRIWKKFHATKIMILVFLMVSLFSSGYLLYLAKTSN
ncbi:MAG: hypothetical protein RR533_08555, partial [Carnobacterium sp.]